MWTPTCMGQSSVPGQVQPDLPCRQVQPALPGPRQGQACQGPVQPDRANGPVQRAREPALPAVTGPMGQSSVPGSLPCLLLRVRLDACARFERDGQISVQCMLYSNVRNRLVHISAQCIHGCTVEGNSCFGARDKIFMQFDVLCSIQPCMLHQGCNQITCATLCAMLCCWIATGVR